MLNTILVPRFFCLCIFILSNLINYFLLFLTFCYLFLCSRHLGGFFLFLGLTIMNLMEINVVGQHISTSSGSVSKAIVITSISDLLCFYLICYLHHHSIPY